MHKVQDISNGEIARDKVISLRDAFEDDIESFNVVEDLATTVLFSKIDTRRKLAHAALCSFLCSPIQLYKISDPDELYLYITFNNIRVAFFHVGTYSNVEVPMELIPDQEETEALTKLALSGIGKQFLG